MQRDLAASGAEASGDGSPGLYGPTSIGRPAAFGIKKCIHLQFRRRDVSVSVEGAKMPKEEKELWSAAARHGRVPFAKVLKSSSTKEKHWI